MNSQPSPEKPPTFLDKVETAALNRWKLETLSGLIGLQGLRHHQHETALNISAENRHVREKLWGAADKETTGDDMQPGNIILGDNTHPAPVVIAGQQTAGGFGPALAGAALVASMIGIPGAGIAAYLLTQLANKPAGSPPPPPSGFTDQSLDLGLRHFTDLKN